MMSDNGRLFSPGICWIGLTKNLSGSEVCNRPIFTAAYMA